MFTGAALMARVNFQGEVEKDVWNLARKTLDENVIYEDGAKARQDGLSKHSNPWPLGTYAHTVWYDGWLNA